jgi:hypothetical protein
MTGKQVDLKQLIQSEFKRCSVDYSYFIRKYVYIQEPVRGRIKFDLYDYQENSLKDFETHNYNIILKGRQIGISTVVAAYALWLMLFHSDKNVLVIATKEKTAKNLILKVQYAYDNLPVWLQVKTVEKNKLSIRFKNGSQIQASAASEDAGRSEALSLLVLDEAAHIKRVDEIWTAALPTLSTGGKAILISTPNGVGNFFHKTYSTAIQDLALTIPGERDIYFHPIKLDWRVHPERDQAWRDKMGRIQGEQKARQEFDADFIGSGNTVIDADLIEWYAKPENKMVLAPIDKRGPAGNLWIWEEPQPLHSYIVVADVSRGDGSDFSTAHVLDLGTAEEPISPTQVAEFKGLIGTTEYGHFLVALATNYYDALLVVERENVGWSVIQVIMDRQYRNLFYMSKDRKVVDVERNLTNRYYREDRQMVPGFGTTLTTRPAIINKLDTYMREKEIIIRSLRTIEELRVFIWDKGKAVAQQGYHDDLVMALCIGLWVRDTAMKLHQEGINLTRAALTNIQRTGGDAVPVYNSRHSEVNDPYKIPTGTTQNPDFEDLRWLLG